jgi:hypothetical protein
MLFYKANMFSGAALRSGSNGLGWEFARLHRSPRLHRIRRLLSIAIRHIFTYLYLDEQEAS